MDRKTVLTYCQSNEWDKVTDAVQRDPSLAVSVLTMRNRLTTSILHQAISARGHVEARSKTIQTILGISPHAAAISNGYGSLPLHVISQRNTNMDSHTKEKLIVALIRAYPEALHVRGGMRERTPLHIAFTDYISPKVIKLMLQLGPTAALIKDKHGWLPIHVACSRHCSPEKLELLLTVHPSSLLARTNKGESPLDLARSTATKSHPNRILLEDLTRRMDQMTIPDSSTGVDMNDVVPIRETLATMDSNRKSSHKITKKRRTATNANAKADDAELLLHFHQHGSKRQFPSFAAFRPKVQALSPSEEPKSHSKSTQQVSL